MTTNNLRLAAFNRHRTRLFGSSSLKVYTTTPAAGEAAAGEFLKDWFAHRVWATTDATRRDDTSAWQFQIKAEADWKTSQAFMKAIVALTVGDERWKVTKIEKPIGVSLIWKIKAQMQ